MKKIAILAYEGCWAMGVYTVTDFFRIVDLLDRHLGHAGAGHRVEILTADGRDIHAASGHGIAADHALSRAKGHDLVVIPAVEGIRLSQGFQPDPRLTQWLTRRIQDGARVLAMTTGACFVAATGLREATLLATHWAFVRPLQKQYPTHRFLAHPSCLQGDGIWSTGSLMGSFDALLEILAQERGDPFAQLVATHLLVSAPEKLNPMLPGHRNHADAVILKVQEWMEAHFARHITIAQMGQEIGMADRTLKRRFQQATGLPPTTYLQKVRVDKAKKLLLATDRSIKAIAYEVGYENVSFFVRVFKTHIGQTPNQWRQSATPKFASEIVRPI